MQCLWLTWTDPRRECDGQQIYSSRLIDALAAQGAAVTVQCFADSGTSCRSTGEGNVEWLLVDRAQRPSWTSVFSTLPHVAHRSGTAAMRARLAALLESARWNCVVLDGFSMGWALPILERHRAPAAPPRLAYISHNHEKSLRKAMVWNYDGNGVYRSLLFLDWLKVCRLERRLVGRADVVTAITPEDAQRYRHDFSGREVHSLPPGYGGRRVADRRITEETPRHAVLLGSFDWLAKQMNLTEFLTVADPLFRRANAGLVVVGRGDPSFLDTMRARFPHTTVVGAVDRIEPYLDSSRIALVPERTGGGFKLKVLDYVFSRLPVAALEDAVAGMPLQSDDSILTYRDHRDLVEGVLQKMDDLDALNRIQDRAYAACANLFDWRGRGNQLLGLLST